MAAPKNIKSNIKSRKKKGSNLLDTLPVGEILQDIAKKEWVLGQSIGKGGFGEIYCAQERTATSKTNFPFAIKIEPHENGPLFVERSFFLKVAKPEEVESWKKAENLKLLGIPTFSGFGSHLFKGQKYRFVVMERYGKDLWSTFLSNNKKFSTSSIYRCALQIIDVLKYIHSKGYVHGDIKGANLLLGLKKGLEHNVFLVDFGLACKYSDKEFRRDPKQAHNGTIEYTSRDWHMGVPTRRGDLEILGFNLLHWAGSNLPWELDLKSPEKVHKKKEELMCNVRAHVKTHYPEMPNAIVQFLDYVSQLKHDERPDYEACKLFFKKELKNLSIPITGALDFSKKATDQVENLKRVRRKKEGNEEQKFKKIKITSGSDPQLATNDQEMSEPDEDSKSDGGVEKPQRKGRSNRLTSENKISWKDAPTIKASNVEKAGEYQRKTVSKKVKK